LHGQIAVQVSLLSRVNMQRASRDALPVSKCVDLLNYYLGFDGWRTRIVEVCREPLPAKPIAMCSNRSALVAWVFGRARSA